MGCAASKPAAKPTDSDEEGQETKGGAKGGVVDAKDVNIGGLSTDGSGGSRTDRSGSVLNEEFVAWSEMETAEEQDYLVDEEKDSRLFERLPSFSEKYGRREQSYNDPAFWQRLLVSCEPEPDGFHLTAPFTLKKAHQLYRYLRTGAAKPLPRKAVYEVLIAACRQLEAQSKEQGALQLVPPPAKGEHLYVCGDTHGQLQDVLWIFELHGEPEPGNAYLFNGDMADRGANAVEIFVLLLAYKLASPGTVYMNRGNHEQRDLNERPFASGGGFAWEVRRKYPHDENLIELFQRLFMLLPIASVVGSWAFVIHGGLFRDTDVTFDDLRKVNNKRQPPIKLDTRDDELLFDALWSDPHDGEGVATGGARGGYSIQFGPDVTRAFCKRTGVKSVIRSHQLPKKQRGFEIAHNSMLLTIFSASNYGGVCRNRGGVLIFDERGPAEVKEFYAPPLAELRQMCDEKLMSSIRDRVRRWSVDAAMGPAHRDSRKKRRKRSVVAENLWTHLLFDTDAEGRLAPRDREVLAEQTRVFEEQQRRAAEAGEGEERRSSSSTKGRRSSARSSASTKGGWPLSRRMSEGLLASGKEGAIERHSLVCAPLRPDLQAEIGSPSGSRKSPAVSRAGDRDRAMAAARAGSAGRASDGRDGGIEVGAVETYQVAYLVEPEMKAECEGEILTSLRMQVCRMRAELTAAFMLEHGLDPAPEAPAAAPEDATAPDEPPRVGKAKTVSHAALYLLPYDRWLKVLGAVLHEYSSILPAYAPRLLATSTGAEAEAEARGHPVNFMRWLDRFQVTIAYENYPEFKHNILQRVLEQTKAKTSGMSMADVLSYFDPKNDGALRITDVANVLRDLQLGLPERQLQQLVYELGFTDPSEEVEPVEVITLILNGLSSYKKRVKRASLMGDTGVRVGVHRASTVSPDTRPPSKVPPQRPPLPRSASSSEHTHQLEALHAMLHANKSKVREALGGDSMVHLFSRADANADGHLSYAETKKVLVELVAVCGGSDEVSEAQLDELISRIDYDGDGKVTFMEFVAAFGLAFCPRLDDDTDAQDISSHLADEMMQQICSALYDRTHALQKAFIFLDEKGEGWLPLDDFESALLLVLSPGADGEHEAARGEQRGEGAQQAKQEDQVLMAAQVKDLVASLKRSHMVNPLKDLQSPEIDYNMFIQSFTVIDTLLDQP